MVDPTIPRDEKSGMRADAPAHALADGKPDLSGMCMSGESLQNKVTLLHRRKQGDVEALSALLPHTGLVYEALKTRKLEAQNATARSA